MSVDLAARVDAELARLNRQAQRSIAKRKRRKARGQCIRCGQLALKPYAQCRNCRERDILRTAIKSEHRKLHEAAENGDQPFAGRQYVRLYKLIASAKLDGRNAYQRGWYQRRVLFHRCVRCGIAASKGIVFCDHHAEKHAAYQRERTLNMTDEQRARKNHRAREYKRSRNGK